MADELDVDAMIERFRERAAAVRQRNLPPVGGDERTAFIKQAQVDFQDFAMLGDADGDDRGRLPRAAGRPASARGRRRAGEPDRLRLEQALAAIDAANADDPNTIEVGGVRCGRRSWPTPS